jgi:hypothetical protein
MAAGKQSQFVEECNRLAGEARRLANTPGITPEEKADLLGVEQRWLSIARVRQGDGKRGHTQP